MFSKQNLFKSTMWGLPLLCVVFTTVAFFPSSDFSYEDVDVSSLSYTEQIRTYVTVAESDRAKLHDFDKLEMTMVEEVHQINKSLNKANELNTERIFLETSQQIPSYKTAIGRSVSNEKGSSLYDKRGKLVDFQPLSNELKRSRKELAQEIAKNGINFPVKITPEDIKRVNSEGKGQVAIVELNEGRLGMMERIMEENYTNRSFTIFQPLGNNKYVPVLKTETNPTISPYSNVCMDRITETTYSNYKINGRPMSVKK